MLRILQGITGREGVTGCESVTSGEGVTGDAKFIQGVTED
jgi:hypothetical protein